MSSQAERLAEYNSILLDVRSFFKDLCNETLSKSTKDKCVNLNLRLDELLKPPERPPRTSGRLSNAKNPDELQSKINDDSSTKTKDGLQLASQEFLEQQRMLSRTKTLWTSNSPEASSKLSQANPKQEEKKLIRKRKSQFFVDTPAHSCTKDDEDIIYEKIQNLSRSHSKEITDGQQQTVVEPPPVPERKGRATSTLDSRTQPFSASTLSGDAEPLMVHDLKNPLYSGLLRNVKANTKQWCVVKRQKLYLFNDLQKPSDFVADLGKYKIYKDPEQHRTFHIKEDGKKSLVLAAVDDEQYELWYNAFRRAKVLPDSELGSVNGETDLAEYVSLRGSVESVDDDSESDSYEKPDVTLEKLSARLSPTIYESMTNRVSSPDSLPTSPQNYVAMEMFCRPIDDTYSSMPLPPTPDMGNVDNDDVDNEEEEKPQLPKRTKHMNATLGMKSINKSDGEFDDNTSSLSDGEGSLSGSFASLIESDCETNKDQQAVSTWPRSIKPIKGKKDKEIEFLRDLSAMYCGVLHQRRMLAVWQKRFCQVKDQCLLCYRQPDSSSEPSLKLELPGYHLDRAEETWKSYSFKLYKDDTDALYFAAENREELIKWLSILAKEMNRDKFKPTDLGGSPLHDGVTSNDDSCNSVENIPSVLVKRYSAASKASTSDFDADSEVSIESEDMEKTSQKFPTNKLLHIEEKTRKGRTKSFDDLEADMQGYLYRKFKNHWSRRWCCVKDNKLNTYKRSPNDPPDLSILLTYATLILPSKEEKVGGYYIFTLRYEADVTTLFSTKQFETWKIWTNCISKYVGSRSSGKFPYVNVPPSSTKESSSTDPDYIQPYTSVSGVQSPLSSNGRRLTSNYQLPLSPPTSSTNAQIFELIPRSDIELKDARFSGILIELQLYNHSYRHLERFAVLTREKQLKFYEDVTASTPVVVFSALALHVVEESRADPLILRLEMDESNKELLFKASSEKDCLSWKKAFERIHYEEIDDVITDEEDDDSTANKILSGDEQSTEKMFRGRSKTIDKKDNSEPVLLAHSKTMPHIGKMKRRAKEMKEQREKDKEKSKTLPPQNPPTLSETPIRERNKITSLIRSFTVDTLARKTKNKSYELPVPREDDFLLKETQHGILKQVEVVNEEIIEKERFCRISGKVFYCYASERDTKPLFKLPLRNAAIEEFADSEINSFKFQITAMDTGKEYSFSLNSESALDKWIAALYGDDQLHKSLDSSAMHASTNTVLLDAKSPKALNTIPPKGGLFSPVSSVDLNLSPSPFDTRSMIATPDSCKSQEGGIFFSDPDRRSTFVQSPAELDFLERRTIRSRTLDSNSSLNSITIPSTANEQVILSEIFFEVTCEGEHSQTTSKRWVILKTTLLEIYNHKKEKEIVKSLSLDSFSIIENEENTTKRLIQLECNSNSIIQLKAANDDVYKVWIIEIKRLQKIHRQNSRDKSRLSINSWRKSSNRDRTSMVLVSEDIKAISEFGRNTDPVDTISGILLEYFEGNKEKKQRRCWIKDGFFYVAKKSKSEKVVRLIDLSTVVILDESDPGNDKYAFKLDYTVDHATKHIYLRAPDQNTADKWMVAVSMGILFHRLSGTVSREKESNKELMEPKDFEFLAFNEDDMAKDKLSKEAQQDLPRKDLEDEEIIPPRFELNEEFSTSDLSPVVTKRHKTSVDSCGSIGSRKQSVHETLSEGKQFKKPCLPSRQSSLVKSDSIDGRLSSTQNVLTYLSRSGSHDSNPPPELPPKLTNDRKINGENSANDEVFALSIEENLELLENIPERDNAEEAFKNVKGILRQQESIRRGILHRQRSKAEQGHTSRNTSNASQKATCSSTNRDVEKSRKIPPKVKPKPKLRTTSSISSYVIVDRYTTFLKDLNCATLPDVRNYKTDLENEKTSLMKCVHNVNNVLSDAKQRNENDENWFGNFEYQTALDDLETMRNRLLLVDKELKNVYSSINRKVSANLDGKRKTKTNVTSLHADIESLSQTNSPVSVKRNVNTHDGGYTSEPLIDCEEIII